MISTSSENQLWYNSYKRLQAIMNAVLQLRFDMSLHVNLVSAQIAKGSDVFSKADPYVIFKLGNEQKESKVKQEGGDNVRFNQNFVFKDQNNILKVIVMEDDTFADDLIGQGQVDISQYRAQSMDQQVFVMVQAHGQPTGKVILRIRGDGNNQWGGNNQFGGQQNQWGNQNQFGNNQYGGQFGGNTGNTGNQNTFMGAAQQLGNQSGQGGSGW